MMVHKRDWIAVVVMLVLGAGAVADSGEKESNPKSAVEARSAAMRAAFAKGEKLGSFYSKEARIAGPSGTLLEGRSAIVAYTEGQRTRGVRGFRVDGQEILASGELVVETGILQALGEAGQALGGGAHILAVWVVEDGAWRIHREIFVGAQAARAAQPTANP